MKQSRLLRHAALLATLLWSLHLPASPADAAEAGFSRILHGWMNYSTAFNATHDPDPDAGDYVTLASFYTPDKPVRLSSYGVIVIWRGETGQHLDFGAFDFQIPIWSSLDEFTNSPTSGDVTNLVFAAPTGGSTTVRDATTRGGRAAYYLSFSLTDAGVTLAPGCTYLIGFNTGSDTSQNGEFYVPTAPSAGPSDVQAGDLVPGDWQYLKDIGGSTVYSGQLATALQVEPLPQLRIRGSATDVEVTWPAGLDGFTLERSDTLAPGAIWLPVSEPVSITNGWSGLTFPATPGVRFFRLRNLP